MLHKNPSDIPRRIPPLGTAWWQPPLPPHHDHNPSDPNHMTAAGATRRTLPPVAPTQNACYG
jgi:hypothetical protein